MLQYSEEVIMFGKETKDEIKDLINMADKQTKDIEKIMAIPEFQKAFEAMQDKRFNDRVEQLKEEGMSEHEALTQAGLERVGYIKADYKNLSLDDRLVADDIRKTLRETFTPDVADKITDLL